MFAILVASDVAVVGLDGLLGRKFPVWLQAWVFIQGLLAIVGIAALAYALRERGYAVFGALFLILVVEDWWQVLAPVRLKMRQAIHAVIPGLGDAKGRLSAADPADLIVVLLGSSVVLVALWASRQENRRHLFWLSGFLALGFAFGGVVDLYNDYNFSRLGIYIEEFGEAIAVSGTLAYLIGVNAWRLRTGLAADSTARPRY